MRSAPHNRKVTAGENRRPAAARIPSVVVYAPQGSGKSLLAKGIADMFGLSKWIDFDEVDKLPRFDTLILAQSRPESVPSGVRVFSLHEVEKLRNRPRMPRPAVLVYRASKGRCSQQYHFASADELEQWAARHPYRDELLKVIPIVNGQFAPEKTVPAPEAAAFLREALKGGAA